MFRNRLPPTCLYPDPLGTVGDVIGGLAPRPAQRSSGENAAALYRI